MILFSKRLPIELTDGSIKEIRSLSATNSEEFKATYNMLSKELEDDKYKSINLVQAYSQESVVRHYIQELFKLINVDPDKVSADVMYMLLFPHETPDGDYHRQGLLLNFIFGEPQGGSKASKEEVDAYAQALGRLWAVMESYKEACHVLQDLSYEDLEEVLKHRAETLKPAEEKAKDKAMQKAIEAKDELTRQFKKHGKIEIGDEVDLDSLM